MKTEFPLPAAVLIARGMVGALKPFCKRIEIAGSIRRRKPMVGDIEIVCAPNMATDMFGGESSESKLEFVDWELYGTVKANGPRLKKIILRQGIQLDLSIVLPPAQWGVIFTLRTGPKDYSHKLVTARRYGGLMPSNYRFQDGAIWSGNHIIETPEEADLFALFGVETPPPHLRK